MTGAPESTRPLPQAVLYGGRHSAAEIGHADLERLYLEHMRDGWGGKGRDRMIARIARKEFTEIVRDGRFRWAAGIVLGLLLLALAMGGSHPRDVSRQHELARKVTRAREQGTLPQVLSRGCERGLTLGVFRLACT